jgi:hypothetical protein
MKGARGYRMRVAWASAAIIVAACAAGLAQAADAGTETLVFVRHGEKPAKGYGQLNCQGLNRALALPAVIAAKFGKPDAIYAPSPAEQKSDDGQPYYYIRPLATIEPTAVQFGMPVQTPFGYSQIEGLQRTLVSPANRGKLVVIAWEHREIEALVRNIVSAYGAHAQKIPKWASGDFDSIYIVKLDWRNEVPRATFEHDQQGLDGRGQDCPCAALPSAASGTAR